MEVQTINITSLPQYKLCQLIDLAGFNVDIGRLCIRLYDKINPKADKYSELEFKSIIEAVKAVQPYVKDRYKFVA